MTHFSKKSLAVAIASLLSAQAHAVLTIYDNTAGVVTTGTALTYASEIVIDDTNNKLANLGTELDMKVDLGFGVATGQNYYPRFDLTNAKFVANPTSVDTLDVGVYSEGGAGASHVIYSLKASADRAVGDDLTMIQPVGALPAGTLAVTSKAPVSVKYRLYQAPAGASQQSDAAQLGPARELTLLNFDSSAVTFSSDLTGTPPQIDVASSSKKFVGGVTTVFLGKLKLEETSGVLLRSGALVTTTAGDIEVAQAGTKLIVEGDFAAAVGSSNKVFLDDANNGLCAVVDKKATAVSTTSAEWTIDKNTLNGFTTGAAAAGTFVDVCMHVDGITEINGGEYKARWVPVSASTYVASEKSVALETLDRNGTVMQSPFFTIVPGYVPRFYLTNTGTSPASFTITLITDADATAPLVPGTTTSGSIPANGALLIKGDQIAASGQRGAAIFQVNGEPNSINGLYNFRTPNGSFDSYVMVKKQ